MRYLPTTVRNTAYAMAHTKNIYARSHTETVRQKNEATSKIGMENHTARQTPLLTGPTNHVRSKESQTHFGT